MGGKLRQDRTRKRGAREPQKVASMKTIPLPPPVLLITIIVTVTLATISAFAANSDRPQTNSSPVLVELFTSEGCSSCPPADALLKKLDASQPIPGADVIVLSEHVDYWNHDGWKDVYSSGFFTDRQENYERRLQVREPYTPQMVVDGAIQLNGSDGPAAARAINAARSHPKISVRIASVTVANPKTLQVHVQVDELPSDLKAGKADIFLAVALDHAESHVLAGENKGRDIQHVAVAASINKVGTVDKTKNFDHEVLVKIPSGVDVANLRLVAFVQEVDGGYVLGAAPLDAPLKISRLALRRTDSGGAIE
jgi:hypothetical protein